MSLFGGDDGVTPTESPTSSVPSSPTLAEPASPPSAQLPQNPQRSQESEVDDDQDNDSEDQLDDFDDEQPSRPNRFTGHPQSWKGYTAADRQIVTSLDQIQNSDLAAHLYNAHALKRRARRAAEEIAGLEKWQSRDSWLKSGSELQYTDVTGEIQKELVPSKDWTAWPLPPARLPGLNDRPESGLANDETSQWIIGGASTHDAGEELREELLAAFLRLAKDAWDSREAEDENQRGRDRTTISRSRSRSKSAISTKSRRSASRVDVDMKDVDGHETNNGAPQDDDEEQSGPGVGKKRGRKSQNDISATPTILADDARAQRLLQPTINSLLSKLDDLAIAVRRTRLNHFGRGGSSDRSSMSEFTSGVDSGGSKSRSSSRARSKTANSRKASTRPSSRATSTRTGDAAKTTKASKSTSKTRKAASISDATSNELDSDALKNTSRTRKRGRSGSITSEESASTTRDWSGRAGLVDWSEVLGLAAVKGWDERAIARTAQRCAALFGESMSFIPFDESLASKPIAEAVHYTPSMIPAPTVLPASGSSASKRPFFQIGTLRCPHVDCYGHEKDFALPYRVVEHCMRLHGYDPRTNDSDNEERTVGGVHIDGFLQPVTSKPGWLGHGRSKAGKISKKQKIGENESAGLVDAVVSIDDSAVLEASLSL